MTASTRLALVALLAALVAAPIGGPGPDRLREELKLDRFYRLHADTDGLPVLGSAPAPDDVTAGAAWIVGRMLDGRDTSSRPCGRPGSGLR